MAGERRSFGRGDDGPLLTVMVMGRNDLPCDVRLRLDASAGRPPTMRSGFQSPLMERVPTLRAPEHVVVTASGACGGDQDWTTQATARTGIAVGELEAHFASQLGDAGWTRLGRGDDGIVSWSSWRLPGEQGWSGMLMVYGAFSKGERSLTLRIEAPRGTGSGVFPTTSTSTS